MDMGLEPWHLWTILAVCLFIGEVFVSGFLLASLGLGALVGALAHQLLGDMGWGIAGFTLGAGAALLLLRPILVPLLGPQESSSFGAESMLGDVITVTDAADIGGSLKARYRDTVWSLRCSEDVFEGDQVVITAVEGTILIVQPAKEE